MNAQTRQESTSLVAHLFKQVVEQNNMANTTTICVLNCVYSGGIGKKSPQYNRFTQILKDCMVKSINLNGMLLIARCKYIILIVNKLFSNLATAG